MYCCNVMHFYREYKLKTGQIENHECSYTHQLYDVVSICCNRSVHVQGGFQKMKKKIINSILFNFFSIYKVKPLLSFFLAQRQKIDEQFLTTTNAATVFKEINPHGS